MLTGQDVMSTGMVSLSPKGPLPDGMATLPEILKRQGYVSTCVGFGDFYRGFDQYLGFEKEVRDGDFDGKSAVPVIYGAQDALRSEFYSTECTWMRKRGWRTPQWKYFEALEPDFHGKPKTELYDLINDPGELSNLAETEGAMCKALKKRMTDWVARRVAETGQPDPILGYKIGTRMSIGSIATAVNLQKR
jgi:arylsulfatase A-like enzyme